MLKNHTPCDDYPFICPYESHDISVCEYFCGESYDYDYPEYITDEVLYDED